jgi:autotransporter adhesin
MAAQAGFLSTNPARGIPRQNDLPFMRKNRIRVAAGVFLALFAAGSAAYTVRDATNTASGDGAVAQGSGNRATGSGAVALGDANAAGAGASVSAIVQGAVAIGRGNNAIGQGSVAIGNASRAMQAGTVALGDAAAADMAAGVALGSGAIANVDGAVAIGAGSVADRLPAPAAGVAAAGSGHVPYDIGDATLLGPVSVGRAASESTATGSYRQIINVADGTGPHDAVTVRQLQGAMDMAQGKAGLVSQASPGAPVTIGADSGGTSVSMAGTQGARRVTGVADGIAPDDGATVNQLNALNRSTSGHLARLDNRIARAEHRANAGIASAMAMAGLPQAYLPSRSMLSIGGATWNGESGYAIGLSTVSGNGAWVLKLSGATSSRGDYGGAVGVGYQW